MADHLASRENSPTALIGSTEHSTSYETTAPKQLSDVKRRILQVKSTAKLRVGDIVSALHAVARATLPPHTNKPPQEVLDAALARISVHARHLTPLFDRRVGARLGYTRPAWRNVVSLTKKGLRAAGAWPLFKQAHIKLSPEWQDIADQSPRLSYVRLLGHWAMMCGITPAMFGDEHLPQFLHWLLTWKPRTYALKCYFAALGDWNKGAQYQPNWPGRPVTVVTRLTGHYSVPREKWSAELRADVLRVMDILRRPDLDEESPHDPVAERVARDYEGRLYLILSAYVTARRIDPGLINAVLVILDPAAAKIALEFQLQWTQRKKPGVAKTSQVHGSAKLLATIADRCYSPRLPAEVVLRLQKMARNRCPVRNGMTPKNRDALRLFDDELMLARFLAKPYEVAAEILKRDKIRRVDAVRFMLALAVAQSCKAPLRPDDQTNLLMGQQVFRLKEGRMEKLAIRLVAKKTKVDLDFELTGDIVELYDAYMRLARPALCEPGNPYLYPGPGLGPKCGGSLSVQVTRFLEDELGLRLTGQQFRHVMGYVYLKYHPGDYETVRQLLGHRDISTTMKFYAAMDMRAASKKVNDFVDKKRQELSHLLRKRRRTNRDD